ncbi:hypothetical protein D3C77_254330 [compost metagenome]
MLEFICSAEVNIRTVLRFRYRTEGTGQHAQGIIDIFILVIEIQRHYGHAIVLNIRLFHFLQGRDEGVFLLQILYRNP